MGSTSHALDGAEPSSLPFWRKNSQWNAEIDPGFLLADIARMMRVNFEARIADAGLTRAQWQVLVYLVRRDGPTQTELANQLDVGKAALGGVLDRLMRSGFIEREGDQSDRRAKRIYITQTGRDLIPLMASKAAELYDIVFDSLSVEQRDLVLVTLQQLRSRLSRLSREALGRDQEKLDR